MTTNATTVDGTLRILRPKETIGAILWGELTMGAIGIVLMQWRGMNTHKITILYAVLLLMIEVLEQCLTDILPLAVERTVPCLCGI